MDVTPEPRRRSYLNPQTRGGATRRPHLPPWLWVLIGAWPSRPPTHSPTGPTTGLTWPRPAGPQLICRTRVCCPHSTGPSVSSALQGLTLHRGHLSVGVSPCWVSRGGLDTGSNKWLISKHLSRARTKTGNWEK